MPPDPCDPHVAVARAAPNTSLPRAFLKQLRPGVRLVAWRGRQLGAIGPANGECGPAEQALGGRVPIAYDPGGIEAADALPCAVRDENGRAAGRARVGTARSILGGA